MNEVVITGIGIISGFGIGKQILWNHLLAADTAIRVTNDWSLPDITSQYFAKIPSFSVKDYVPMLKPPLPPRYVQMGLVATALAVKDAQLDLSQLDPNCIGMILSTDFGPNETVENYLTDLFMKGPEAVSPIQFSRTVANVALGDISRYFHFRGPSSLIIGESSLCYAYDILQEGRAEIMICGGLDEVRDTIVWAYQQLGLLAKPMDQEIVTDSTNFLPYSSNAAGSVLGDATAVIVLETRDHANRRNAPCYAQVRGYKTLCDRAFNHLVTERTTEDLEATMLSAIDTSNIPLGEVGFVIGCASSHPNIGNAELLACGNVWKDSKIYLTSIKGAVGETFASSSILSVAIGALSLSTGLIPPCGLIPKRNDITDRTFDTTHIDLVLNRPQQVRTNSCLVNSIHIGGNNCSVVLTK